MCSGRAVSRVSPVATMLPISRLQVGRDWMEIFTILVWFTVILIMFLAKLKATQDVLIAMIMMTIMAIVNADALFSKFRFYKVYLVLRKPLGADCQYSFFQALFCLVLHGIWPEARGPGILLHILSFVAWVQYGVQTSPMVTCGIWYGGTNQLTKIQLGLRLAAQWAGGFIAFAMFGLWYSFRFPGEGPFGHIFCLEGAVCAAATFGASILHIRHYEARTLAERSANNPRPSVAAEAVSGDSDKTK